MTSGARLEPPPVYRVTLAQLVTLIPVVSVLFYLAGSASASSFAAGGACSVVPQAWFALALFGWPGRARSPRQAAVGFGAEAGKFMLSAVGFALVFALIRPLDALAVFAGFILMTFIHIACSARLLRQ